jgi:hypothetical protein
LQDPRWSAATFRKISRRQAEQVGHVVASGDADMQVPNQTRQSGTAFPLLLKATAGA